MRSATAVPLVGLALAMPLATVGCGGRGPSDSEQVVTTVQAFARATASKDYTRLCRDILAGTLVTRIQRAGVTCRDALQTGLQDVRDPHVTVGKVSIDGDAATAEVRTTASGQAPSTDRLRLVRERGHWRIASLAGP